jgi:hypothetical protein
VTRDGITAVQAAAVDRALAVDDDPAGLRFAGLLERLALSADPDELTVALLAVGAVAPRPPDVSPATPDSPPVEIDPTTLGAAVACRRFDASLAHAARVADTPPETVARAARRLDATGTE